MACVDWCSLILPFLRVGEWIFGSQPFELSKDALWQAISGQASKKVLLAILHAVSFSVYPFSCNQF
jgi:hypothetical protein